jgi:hypothetical protein
MAVPHGQLTPHSHLYGAAVPSQQMYGYTNLHMQVPGQHGYNPYIQVPGQHGMPYGAPFDAQATFTPTGIIVPGQISVPSGGGSSPTSQICIQELRAIVGLKDPASIERLSCSICVEKLKQLKNLGLKGHFFHKQIRLDGVAFKDHEEYETFFFHHRSTISTPPRAVETLKMRLMMILFGLKYPRAEHYIGDDIALQDADIDQWNL